jgi:hypothetical protein
VIFTPVDATIISNNIGGPTASYLSASSNQWAAQRFNSDAVYRRLSNITLRLGLSTAGNFSLSLYSDVSGQPGSSVATLFSGSTTSIGVPSLGDVSFPGLSQAMNANTNFWLVLSVAPGYPTVLSWPIEAKRQVHGAPPYYPHTGFGWTPISSTSMNHGSIWTNHSDAPMIARIEANAVLPGDYNQNGVVDAADYTVWRDTLGQVGESLVADGDDSLVIDAGDYDVWKAHYGEHAGSGASAGANVAAAEPATLSMLLIGIMTLFCRGRFLAP